MVHLRFERGTLSLDGHVENLKGVLWDARSSSFRAAAHRFRSIAEACEANGVAVSGDLRERWPRLPRSSAALGLRPYQEQALAAWNAGGQRGLVVLPTGAGKTRIATAAIMETGLPAAILCPTRVLASAWVADLEARLGERVGCVGDGKHVVARITVFTFESAYRHMDRLGDGFGLLVVDEVHHFGGGFRLEALESCAAIARMGLTATAPERRTEAAATLDDLVGPVVFEMSFGELVGEHLAPLTMMRRRVELDPYERAIYAEKTRLFQEMRRAFFRTNRGADYAALVKSISGVVGGARVLRDHADAMELAAFPRAKRRIVAELLEAHRGDRTIVFTAYAENAYRVARDNLVPVIAAETSARERESILTKFREGTLRAIASARVLNEGVDVPDANVAIIVAGTLGPREYVQRIGRVLRPARDKHALVYELVTDATSDERHALVRGRHAPQTSH
ncbi:DNA helicase [Labilithrix luteola]|uniref:DNA helicase n=1 Tax=Labilithrix luteola TaxID=1391654 RepID=A0A0K1PLZ2_9BACT|nr:DEAD/DEAH box helicase family protein [Labilithrix luteola]AKU94542.1 DNA helicase [Labilithrix luteola]